MDGLHQSESCNYMPVDFKHLIHQWDKHAWNRYCWVYTIHKKSFDKHNFVCKLLFQLTKIGVSISGIYHKITLNSWKVYEWFIYASVTLISLVQIMACHLAGTSHYLNQCWNIINWTLRNKLQWNVYRNSCIFIQENECTNLAWEKAAILSRPWYVKHCWILSIKTVQQSFHSKVQSSMTYHKQSSNHIN